MLYGQACACRVDRAGKVVTGHTGWLLTMHADFSREYLRGVRSKTLARSRVLVVKRSAEFNVKPQDQRVMALSAVMGLLRFMKSGDYPDEYLKRLGAR